MVKSAQTPDRSELPPRSEQASWLDDDDLAAIPTVASSDTTGLSRTAKTAGFFARCLVAFAGGKPPFAFRRRG